MKRALLVLAAFVLGASVATITAVSADAPVAYREYRGTNVVRDWNVLPNTPCLASGTDRRLVPQGQPLSVCTATTTTSTTVAPATTTTVPSTTTTTTTTTPPVTTTTTVAPTTTLPTGTQFSESFASMTSLTDFVARFDHGWSGEWNAGALFGESRNDWHGDHDMACGDPNMTNRTIHLTDQQQANDAPFYVCVPGGDSTKAHVMTSVNTEGYVSIWFSPKKIFSGVSRVCWDQNITNEGGGKWTAIGFLVPAEYQGQTDLGYNTPDFPSSGPSSPQGPFLNGVKVFQGGMTLFTDGADRGSVGGTTVTDKAARYQHCVIDNNNGTVTLTIAQPTGTVSNTISGGIPDGSIRVVFVDDNYNPDKHFNDAGVAPNSSNLYTWHWDNIEVG